MSDDLQAKLAQLKQLHELELLTDEDFKEQKRALLAAALGTTPAPSSAPALAGATTVGAPPSAAAPAPAATDPLAGATTADPTAGLPSRLGNYRVLGIIGAGGMGTVVRARHVEEGWAAEQGGDVAIKLIHPEIASDDAFRKRFFSEAALGKRVQHPGLATVYDVVQEGPWLGTILEYIEGRELTEWVRPGGLPVEEVLSLLTPLAEALDHLHSQGIVHRDLKPANVKVRPNGRPVLLDLGIAKDLSGQSGGQTQTMTTMGTSAWMAPEQADAKSVTAAADVYALGLVAYALLSGRMPWGDGESELRVLTNKMMGKLAPLGSVVPGLSAALSAAVMDALSVEPSGRPSGCVALVASLDSKRRAAVAAEDAAEEQARREAVARKAEEEHAKRAAEEKARRDAAARKAAEEAERARRAAGPQAHTHRYEVPLETYTANEWRVVCRTQERAGERFEVDGNALVLVTIPAGIYEVGRGPGEGRSTEQPKHAVRLSRAYSMGIHPVTQGLYASVMGKNPSRFSDARDSARRPVEEVSWFEAVAFCNRLSDRCGLSPAYRISGEDVRCDFSSSGFRLPTEHEWEVAARADADLLSSLFWLFSGSDDLDSVGWFDDNSGDQTHPVGQKAPNGWGLYDLSGNVYEWCWDWFDSSAYQSGTMVDPAGPQSGSDRVVRGGSWAHTLGDARVVDRFRTTPGNRWDCLGLRLTRTLP